MLPSTPLHHLLMRDMAGPIVATSSACELLGLDPQYVANEGRFLAFVPPDQAPSALRVMKSHRPGARASRIGAVGPRGPGIVTVRSRLGTRRVLDRLSCEQLPRIC